MAMISPELMANSSPPSRKRPEEDKRGHLPSSVSIEGRPAVVDRRSRYGDWEGDTIVGANRRGGAVTLVERKSGSRSTLQSFTARGNAAPTRAPTVWFGISFPRARTWPAFLSIGSPEFNNFSTTVGENASAIEPPTKFSPRAYDPRVAMET